MRLETLGCLVSLGFLGFPWLLDFQCFLVRQSSLGFPGFLETLVDPVRLEFLGFRYCLGTPGILDCLAFLGCPGILDSPGSLVDQQNQSSLALQLNPVLRYCPGIPVGLERLRLRPGFLDFPGSLGNPDSPGFLAFR